MTRFLSIVLLAVLAVFPVAACGGTDEIAESDRMTESDRVRAQLGLSDSPLDRLRGAFDTDTVVVEREVVKDVKVVVGGESIKEVPVEVVVEKEVLKAVEVPGESAVTGPRGQPGAVTGPSGQPGPDTSDGTSEMATLVRQQRIVVRTVDISLVVSGIQAAMDDVAALADGMGGWTVSSERADDFSGFVTVRVPAERLDEAIARLRDIAVEVESEITTSKDVTAEYFDSQSRLRNMRATETALLNLLERASTARDALAIRNSLSEVQEEIEVLLGRLKLLEETSVFSLVRVYMQLERGDFSVDAGPDQTTAVGRSIRFRAFFEPPDDIEHFTYTWDFGDGTHPVTGNRAILTEDSRRMVTAVTHYVYDSATESPYIVQIKMVGTGEAGAVEGEDKAVVTVTEAPVLIVSAGERLTVEEGANARLRGTFTRPVGVTNLRYRWTFRDGSAPVEGVLGGDATTIEVDHTYIHEGWYVATLTVTGDSEVGAVEASSDVQVRVVEGRGWVVVGYDLRGNARDAVRLLSVVFRGIVTGAIWIVILTPLWGALFAVVFLLNRLSKRLRPRPSPPPSPSEPEETKEDPPSSA